MANNAAGLAGILCVIAAGWTTANPTIYRAGLAFQAIIPTASRFKVTLVAGTVATIAGIFPAFAWKLLGFVGIYGTILAPIGAIIFFDWHFRCKGNADTLHNTQPSSPFNLSVLFAWLLPVGIALYFIQAIGVSPWIFPLPCWIACGLLYLAFNRKSASA
jgi:NCS1 family nucleobase:cation symporter-1